MDVVSLGPLRVASLPWRQQGGGWVLTVACKATCVLLPGEAPLADVQEDCHEDDGYWDDDPGRSLYTPSDLAPFKQRADVVLVGHAFAPDRKPARSVVARLLVGEVDKSVEVLCSRAWTAEGALREGARFTRMPLRYERAAGGPGTSNPVGVPSEAQPDAYGSQALPNLQPPGLVIASEEVARARSREARLAAITAGLRDGGAVLPDGGLFLEHRRAAVEVEP